MDTTDGMPKEKTGTFVEAVSATQLECILNQIRNLVLSKSLSELDTIVAQLHQVKM